MKKNKKFYVVWEGKKTGIFETWDECKESTKGFKGARFKSFPTYEEAKIAFEKNDKNFSNNQTKNDNYLVESICVDAACAGNPGELEFRGVYTKTSETLFHHGPFELGTNNLGEFLGIVYGIQYLQKHNQNNTPIYSDSITALSWVKNKKINSNLIKNKKTEILWKMIDDAIQWLKENHYENPLIKWDTDSWGEIKADFGRKSNR